MLCLCCAVGARLGKLQTCKQPGKVGNAMRVRRSCVCDLVGQRNAGLEPSAEHIQAHTRGRQQEVLRCCL